MLDHARQEQQSDEQHDAKQDAHQRDAELADLEAEEQGLRPIANVGPGKTPLQHEQRQRHEDEGEHHRDLAQLDDLALARAVDAEPVFEQRADGAGGTVPPACDRANTKIEQPCNGQHGPGQDNLLRYVAAECHVADCGARNDGDREHPKGQLDRHRREPAHGTDVERVEMVHGAQRAGLRDEWPEQEQHKKEGSRDVCDEALRDRYGERHINCAAEFHQDRVEDVDRENGLHEN